MIAHRDRLGWSVLAVGHTSNLADQAWASELAQARVSHPDAELLVRLNVSRALREEEAADLAHLIGRGREGPAAGS